jgi:sugar phosphate isomerase/epimerase
MTNIPDAGSAWELADLAGRPNAGLCVDSWHHFRGANDLDLLGSVPAERVFVVQINDGPRTRVHSDYYRDCTETRLPPGEGDFDLAAFVRTLEGMGVTVPYSVEVLSTELLARETPAELALHLATRTRTLISDLHRGPAGHGT